MNSSVPVNLPTACAICGQVEGIEPTLITRTYTPPWVWIFLPFGVLTAILIGMAVQVKHTFMLLLCPRCRKRRAFAKLVSWLSIIICVVLLFVAIIAGMATKSWIVFIVGIGVTVTVAIAAGKFDKTTIPSYPVYTKKRVEIEIPNKGRFTLLDDGSARTA